MTEEARRVEHKRVVRRDHRAQGARYSYVILAVMCLFFGLGSYLYTNYRSDQDTRTNNQKFCGVITGVISGPVKKPTDPAKQPITERTYEHYLTFLQLGKDLGCIKP